MGLRVVEVGILGQDGCLVNVKTFVYFMYHITLQISMSNILIRMTQGDSDLTGSHNAMA